MTASACTLEEVHRHIDVVKARRPGVQITNYFRAEMVGPRIRCTLTSSTVLFANQEHDFHRLFFYSTEPNDLTAALKAIELPGSVVCTYLTKSASPEILASLRAAGFSLIATYARMTNSRLPARNQGTPPQFASAEELDDLHAALFTTFNRYTDHLPTRERLARYIANQQVLVSRNQGRLTGAIVFQLQGHQVNYNYLFSRSPNPLDVVVLQSAFYRLMAEKGIRTGVLWVDRTNERTIRMQQRLGWKFDGLEDHIHLKQFPN